MFDYWLAREWSSTIASIHWTLDNTDGLVSCMNHAAAANVDTDVLITRTCENDIAIVKFV